MNRVKRSKLERYCAWKAHKQQCGVTGIFIKLSDMHLDHIVPLAAGGEDNWYNLIPVHRSVNLAKGCHKYSDEVRDSLLIKAAAKYEELQELLKKTASIPKEEANQIDLTRVQAEEILADLGPTPNWNMNDLATLVIEWLRYGIRSLEKLAVKLGRSVHAIKCKLVSIGIWKANFIGQKSKVNWTYADIIE